MAKYKAKGHLTVGGKQYFTGETYDLTDEFFARHSYNFDPADKDSSTSKPLVKADLTDGMTVEEARAFVKKNKSKYEKERLTEEDRKLFFKALSLLPPDEAEPFKREGGESGNGDEDPKVVQYKQVGEYEYERDKDDVIKIPDGTVWTAKEGGIYVADYEGNEVQLLAEEVEKQAEVFQLVTDGE